MLLKNNHTIKMYTIYLFIYATLAKYYNVRKKCKSEKNAGKMCIVDYIFMNSYRIQYITVTQSKVTLVPDNILKTDFIQIYKVMNYFDNI